MMYTRAAASDYDDWMRLGNPGWGAADLIPLAQKVRPHLNYNPHTHLLLL
jgi:alcohol oxidase